MTWLDQIHFDENGLIPVVAQEATSGDVLMLAFANRAALESTQATGRAHYWSRSRERPWIKGETSGHVQEVVEIRVDCDGDSVLYRVNQTGPACHTLRPSCFYRSVDGETLVERPMAAHILARVEEVIAERERSPREGSYTTYLFGEGVDKILKKIGEESTEVVIAGKNPGTEELKSESADLLFHLLVLLRARKLPMSEVWKVLNERFGRPPRPRTNHRKGEDT